MNDPSAFTEAACPYCGEWITLALDASVGAQQYIEDCQVCCKPINVSVDWDEGGEPQVDVRTDDE